MPCLAQGCHTCHSFDYCRLAMLGGKCEIGKQLDLSNQGAMSLEGVGRETGEGSGVPAGFLLSFGPAAHV